MALDMRPSAAEAQPDFDPVCIMKTQLDLAVHIHFRFGRRVSAGKMLMKRPHRSLAAHCLFLLKSRFQSHFHNSCSQRQAALAKILFPLSVSPRQRYWSPRECTSRRVLPSTYVSRLCTQAEWKRVRQRDFAGPYGVRRRGIRSNVKRDGTLTPAVGVRSFVSSSS